MELPAVDLTGQIAIVTGGGRGLGQSMAQTLAAAGAAVAIVGRTAKTLDDTVSLIKNAGGRAISIEADVTDRISVERMVRKVENQLGAIDVLVNNAGVVGIPGPVSSADPDAWWQVFDVNVRGTFLCTRAVIPGMISRKRGRIINLASVAALIPVAHGTAYSASKAAIARFSECLAEEVREHNIAVFVIHPGNVRTDMMNYLIESEEGKKWLPWIHHSLESGNEDEPEPAANLVTLLASGQADGLAGCFIQVRDNVPDMIQNAESIQRDDLHRMRLRV